MDTSRTFTTGEIEVVNEAVGLAEEVVSNAFKMSASQWLRRRYDVKTRSQLDGAEVVAGPFAQVIRYQGRRRDTSLGSEVYDFYKICLQDHAILDTLDRLPDLELLPFTLYIVVHELVHIVRFSQFLQNFEASSEEMMAEEARVHRLTREIIAPLPVTGIEAVLAFFARWHQPIDGLRSPALTV